VAIVRSPQWIAFVLFSRLIEKLMVKYSVKRAQKGQSNEEVMQEMSTKTSGYQLPQGRQDLL
jgi:hypothetical protein